MARPPSPFPYKRARYTDDQVRQMFAKLQAYDVKTRMRVLKVPVKIRSVKVPATRLQFLGKYLVLVNKASDYEDFNQLSDMFQEECRMQCTVVNSPSPAQFYQDNLELVKATAIEKYGDDSAHSLREAIYSLTKECTSHRPSNMMAMIRMFKARTVLDFSAGWGDRLIGALAAGVEYYCGVDPNPCLHPGYSDIHKFFGGAEVLLIEAPIETAVLPDRQFDLVYTSPPYFDMEIYGVNNAQSTKHKREKEWFDQFLCVALSKVWGYLREGGTMAININQKKGEHYVNWMLEYGDTLPQARFLGMIAYSDEKMNNPQPIWVWKKGPG